MPHPRRFPRAALLAGLVLAAPTTARAEGPPSFERDVRPILKAHCFHCHGENAKPKAGLDLRLVRTMKKGGVSGAAVVPGEREESLLWIKVDEGEMPPVDKKLSAREKEVLAAWIDQGAPTARPEPASADALAGPTEEEKSFWSFRPIRRPEVPRMKATGRAGNPIDAFLLSRLEAVGLGFSPEADRPTLIRRLAFDLTGLPPTPEEVDAFEADPAPDAYERLVDRLLASPRYGERWARHWMDVAGYADSDGYTARDDVRPFAYKYRDYLVRSINADRPWDVLIREQLAGDEMVKPPYSNLSPADVDRLTATGFLRTAPDGTADRSVDPTVARNDVIAETVKIVSTTLLGLTVGCAQCHNHRYDPISQADYYRFRALFEPAYDPSNWRPPSARLVSLWTEADRKRAAEVEAKVAAIAKERSEAVNELVKTVLERELAAAPEELRGKLRAARETPPAKRSAEQKELLKAYPRVNVTPGNVTLYDARAFNAIVKRFAAKTEEAQVGRPAENAVATLTEVPGRVPVTHLFDRGDPRQPKQAVAPGELAVLAAVTGAPAIPADDPALPTTGRRLAYAVHLTGGKHPLVPRVLVNRVWMHHFGRGLVETPADFGALGTRPTHPELLDWLADDFVRGGWTLKRLHRLIVTSTAYRQSSRRTPALDAADADNRLLGRAPVRRLEAEAVRDAALFAGGGLNPTMCGPPAPVAPDEAGQVIIGRDTRDSAGRPTGKSGDLGAEARRRSLYVQVRRSLPLGVLETFDAPLMAPNCERRGSSTVAPQSLLLMNSTFMVECSEAFAARLASEAGADATARVALAWRLALGRDPTPGQVADALAFVARQQADLATGPDPKSAPKHAWASLCQALMSSNAFLYVD
jgi:mono/diheme cytochrome c family protein